MKNRLTTRLSSATANLKALDCTIGPAEKSVCRQIAFDRLADYEDSGLTPEEVQALKVDVENIKKNLSSAGMNPYFIERLQTQGATDVERILKKLINWLDADDEARLVILPADIGAQCILRMFLKELMAVSAQEKKFIYPDI